jgi:biotin transport system substrate-specific component
MTTNAIQARRRVLADVVPGGGVRDVALVIGAAVLTGLAAQVAIPLPFTPVPLSLQTFTVLLSAAALGPYRAGAAMLLYVAAGISGVPWFAEQRSGVGFPSFGYLIGFIAAALLVGALARRGADRSLAGAALTMILGNLVIYAIGVPYLAMAIGVDLPTAIGLGLTPFLAGDGLKILLATGLLPGAWRLAGGDRYGA